MSPTAPFLCFLTDNVLHQDFCRRYWKVSNGAWAEKFEVMLEESGLGKWDMLGIVKSSCNAYLLDLRCNECGRPAEVKNRSSYSPVSGALTRTRYRSRYRCRTCADIAFSIHKKPAAVAPEGRHVQVKQFLSRTLESATPVDYSAISYVTSFFLYCVLVAANSGWQGNRLTRPDTHPGELAPTRDLSALAYKTLFEQKIIFPDPATDLSTFHMADEDGTADFAFGAVSWKLAPDATGRTMNDVFSLLLTRLDDPEPKAVEHLWFLVAESECRKYFLKQCDRYHFLKPDIYSAKVADAVRDYLPHFSIGQVWNVIYYVLKDLAALSQEKTYARQHVYNMIPGQIRRYFDYRIANSRPIHPWRRPALITESWMTSILLDKVLGDGNTSFEQLTGQSVRYMWSFCAHPLTAEPPQDHPVFTGP